MKQISLDNTVGTNAFVRLLFMVLFFALFGVGRFMLWAVVLVQFLSHLFTGRVTHRGSRWGQSISDWMYAVMLFMSYNTERMPFPFAGFSRDRDL
jgi:hypothetical protein